jgi:hypothetical protein
VAGAPPFAVYHQCTPTQWDDWYKLVTDLGESTGTAVHVQSYCTYY